MPNVPTAEKRFCPRPPGRLPRFFRALVDNLLGRLLGGMADILGSMTDIFTGVLGGVAGVLHILLGALVSIGGCGGGRSGRILSQRRQTPAEGSRQQYESYSSS